jgi:hypothetical protein
MYLTAVTEQEMKLLMNNASVKISIHEAESPLRSLPRSFPFGNTKDHYLVRNSLPLDPILSQMNSVHPTSLTI